MRDPSECRGLKVLLASGRGDLVSCFAYFMLLNTRLNVLAAIGVFTVCFYMHVIAKESFWRRF